MMLSKIGLIILAAGASTRLGQPKQLLLFRGKTFLTHTVEQALGSCCRPIIVVLGSQAEQIQLEINSFPIIIVKNYNWVQGMSASIQTGLEQLKQIQPDSQGVVITLCDQPFISSEIIDKLVETHKQIQNSIVVSEYNNILGVPALFSQILFDELMNLDTTKGAKSVIQNHANHRSIVPYFLNLIQGNHQFNEPFKKLNIFTTIVQYPIRMKCAALSWSTLESALKSSPKHPTS